MAPYVLADTRDGVCTLTLNRGDRFNPLSTRDDRRARRGARRRRRRRRASRVVVLAGAGRAFCAGHDLTEMRAHIDPAWQRGLFDACTRMMLKLTQIPQPVIARVHGAAAAAGCQLVSMCDLAVAADHAKFGLSGINAGIFCSTPAVGGRAQRVAQARDGAPAHRRAHRRAHGAGRGDSSTASCRCATSMPPCTRSRRPSRARARAVVALGKRAFYAQIERRDRGRLRARGRDDGVQHARSRRRGRHRRLPVQAPAKVAFLSTAS